MTLAMPRDPAASPLPSFRIRRAEAAYRDAQKAHEAREARERAAIVDAHARRREELDEAERLLASPHRDLREALGWFEAEWTAAYPLALHEKRAVELGDVWGSAAWTERWKTWLTAHDPDREQGDPPPYDPLRRAHMAMSTSTNLWDRCAAAYLFRLACLGFDPLAAGRNMPEPLPVSYTAGYAKAAVDRLRQVVARERTRPRSAGRPEWMDRLGIGKSDAQHSAEEQTA